MHRVLQESIQDSVLPLLMRRCHAWLRTAGHLVKAQVLAPGQAITWADNTLMVTQLERVTNDLRIYMAPVEEYDEADVDYTNPFLWKPTIPSTFFRRIGTRMGEPEDDDMFQFSSRMNWSAYKVAYVTGSGLFIDAENISAENQRQLVNLELMVESTTQQHRYGVWPNLTATMDTRMRTAPILRLLQWGSAETVTDEEVLDAFSAAQQWNVDKVVNALIMSWPSTLVSDKARFLAALAA